MNKPQVFGHWAVELMSQTKDEPSFTMFLRDRNRLENNTEHWNALLLSLRELIEWVIRKDTELTGLGPIRGDLSTLVKQQVSFSDDNDRTF